MVEKNSKVSEKYVEMIRAGVACINAGQYFEETLREQIGKIRIKPKAITLKDGQAQVIDVSKKLLQHGTKAVEYAKKFNDVVSQVMINKNGQDDIDCMAFELGVLYTDIACLSLTDQDKVKELVDSLKNK